MYDIFQIKVIRSLVYIDIYDNARYYGSSCAESTVLKIQQNFPWRRRAIIDMIEIPQKMRSKKK